jgi:histidyl-tRNA synthetase
VEDTVAAIRAADKLDKVGEAGVVAILTGDLGLAEPLARRCLDLARIRTADASFADAVGRLGVKSDLLDQGLQELTFVLDELRGLPRGAVLADLSIARGFDYYTGSVYEGRLVEYPGFGSVCSGGRYDDLAGSFVHRRLPGVGISVGLTRIFAKLAAEGRLPLGPKSPTHVLVVLPGAERRAEARATADRLRARGFNVELYHAPDKLRQQVRYASRKAIPYVWFPPFEDGQPHEVKDMRSGSQGPADPEAWQPE